MDERLRAILDLAANEATGRGSLLLVACAEFPDHPEPWRELARFHGEQERWWACRNAAMASLRAGAPPDDRTAEALAAIASEHLGEPARAAHHARRATRPIGRR